MNTDLITRSLWAAGIILAGLGLYFGGTRLQLALARRTRPEIPDAKPGVPSILYFTTPECVPCRTVQRPALRQISAEMGNRLQVIEVNAYERPDLADQWGVLSVPTTFIIDSQGNVRHVNHGVTRTEKLLDQLAKVH